MEMSCSKKMHLYARTMEKEEEAFGCLQGPETRKANGYRFNCISTIEQKTGNPNFTMPFLVFPHFQQTKKKYICILFFTCIQTDSVSNYVDVFFIFTQIKNSDDMRMLMAIKCHYFRNHQLLVNFVLTKFSFRYGLDSAE